MPARIIGIGQPMAGDDAAGLAAIRMLRERGVPQGIDLTEVAEPSALVPMLIDGADPVILIDAVVDAGSPGRILRIVPGKAKLARARLLSTHGLGVLEAVKLARTLHPDSIAPRIAIIGITISRPTCYSESLSPAVARAARRAAAQALRLARSPARTTRAG